MNSSNKFIKIKMGCDVIKISCANGCFTEYLAQKYHDFLCAEKPSLHVIIRFKSHSFFSQTQKYCRCSTKRKILMWGEDVRRLRAHCDLNQKKITMNIIKTNDAPRAEQIFIHAFKLLFGYYLIMKKKSVLLHSLGIIRNNRAILFCGRSGSGKSFLAKHYAKNGKAEVMNDECILLALRKQHVHAYSTIFAGKEELKPKKTDAVLDRIYFMRFSKRNKRIRKGKMFCFTGLLYNSFLASIALENKGIIKNREFTKKYFTIISDLSSKIAFYDLERAKFRKNEKINLL